jgi:hypothetical protein
MAVAAIMRSVARRRGFRPTASTAATTRPYARAASASNGMGSNSCSARCSTSSRRARSAASKYESCSSSGRTSWGPADSSASVTALIATSSGSWRGSIRVRRIRMFVSARPRVGTSAVMTARGLLGGRILICPERIGVYCRCTLRHRSELSPRHEPPALPQWHQFADAPTITRDRESLTAFDGVHDLARPHPEVALSDFWLTAHEWHGSTCCYRVPSAGLMRDRSVGWQARRRPSRERSHRIGSRSTPSRPLSGSPQ